ncbi:MAG: PKD domain-containing protein [Thermoplasmata archaeon]|nr:PKD domain-containing protein [Thermoplasmata archaeon]
MNSHAAGPSTVAITLMLVIVATAAPHFSLAPTNAAHAVPSPGKVAIPTVGAADDRHANSPHSAPYTPVPDVSGTPTWTNLTATAGAPPPRISGGLVYDGEDGYTILFGGEYLNLTTFHYTYYNDTWEFSGGRWTNITPTHSPSPRFGFGIAFDPLEGEVLLFGGDAGSGAVLNDTWEFSGGSWSNLSIGHAPIPRFWPSMAFDSATNNVVLFGGLSRSSSDLNDTWTFSSGAWSQAAPITHPQSRHGAGLMDDPQSTDVVLFGGLGTEYYNTTWTWSGTDWANVTTSSTASSLTYPDGRVGPGGAFDTALNEEVMYGGFPSAYYPYGTWVFSNLTWTLYNNLPGTPPSGTVWDQFTYDAADSWIVYEVPSTGATFVFNETSGGRTGLTVLPSASPLSGVVPLTVSLSATVSGGTAPYNVTWTLGNGSSLYVANTSATYSTPGTYNLTLTVHDAASGLYSVNWTVRAEAPTLHADASAVPSVVTVGQSVSFDSTFTGGWPPITFSWGFGDGGHATTQNTTHAYASAATFDVSYEISASIGGSVYINFTEQVVTTLPELTLQASVTPLSGLAPLTVTASSTPSGGEPPYAYQWTWGDGSGAVTNENATHTFSVPGTYLVHLNVSDSAGSVALKAWTITVMAPLSVVIAASTQTPSVGESVTFDSVPAGGSAPYTYLWSFGDGHSATTRNATHAYGTAGVFVVNLTVTDSAQRSATASLRVTVSASAPATSGQSGSFSTTDWLALIVILIVIAVLIAVVWSRRRKKPPT